MITLKINELYENRPSKNAAKNNYEVIFNRDGEDFFRTLSFDLSEVSGLVQYFNANPEMVEEMRADYVNFVLPTLQARRK